MTYTVDQIAQELGVNSRTVAGWVTSGELKAFCVSSSLKSKKPRWRITGESLAAFQALRGNAQSPQKLRKRGGADPAIVNFYA